jgi:hypothetical protein
MPGQAQVLLWVKKQTYFHIQPIEPVWFNFIDIPIYLPGCATYDLEAFDGSMWKNLGSTVDCGWEGLAVKVLPKGAHVTHDTYIDLGSSFGQYLRFRFRGYWYEGCLDNQPISTAQCAGSHEVLSGAFQVEWPPD